MRSRKPFLLWNLGRAEVVAGWFMLLMAILVLVIEQQFVFGIIYMLTLSVFSFACGLWTLNMAEKVYHRHYGLITNKKKKYNE